MPSSNTWTVFSRDADTFTGGTRRSRPHLNAPGSNVSNMQLNPDQTIRNLGGCMEITSARADEPIFRFALRLQF